MSSPLTRIQIAVHLQDSDLFRWCTAEQTMRIAVIVREERFEAGSRIYTVDDPADAMYVVVDGSIRLAVPESDERFVGPGGTFGVEEILADRLRGATAVAERETVALTIDAADLFDLLSNNIEIVKALFRRILGRRGTVDRNDTTIV